MYRALIVEDELLMRQYLLDRLHDIHPDFCAAASAADGLEAMSLMQKEIFDLVITDIRMPGMDGLSLSKYICASHPDTHVIILSGYDEFEYAREAVRLNVCDYLLKPVNDGELTEALQRVSQVLAQKRQRRLNDSCFPMLFRDAMAGMPQKTLHEYARKLNGMSAEAGKAHWGLMVIAPNPVDIANLREPVDTGELLKELFALAFDSFLGLAAMDMKGSTVILVLVRDPLLVQTECQNGCRRLNETFAKNTGISLLGGFSKAHDSLDQLRQAYEEAEDALLLARVGDGPFLSGDLLFVHRTRLNVLKSILEPTVDLNQANRMNPVNSLCMRAASCLKLPVRKDAFLLMGAVLLARCFDNRKLELAGLKHLIQMIPEKAESQADYAKAYAACFASLLMEEGKASQGAIPSLLTQKVLDYLHLHFRESVSLSMAADAFHVTPAYISALFHKEVGESYSKYLMRLRMEYAAVRLKSDPSIKMYDVAKQAGFVSPKHFIAAFGKFFGKTPKEYQELHGK